jgi:hypothetical protein
MNFGRMVSIAIAMVAILGVFVEIPVVSDYAFWIMVVALLVWLAVHPQNPKNRFRLATMASISLLLVAIVGLFVGIPIISDYAFWILAAAYLVIVGNTKLLAEPKKPD